MALQTGWSVDGKGAHKGAVAASRHQIARIRGRIDRGQRESAPRQRAGRGRAWGPDGALHRRGRPVEYQPDYRRRRILLASGTQWLRQGDDTQYHRRLRGTLQRGCPYPGSLGSSDSRPSPVGLIVATIAFLFYDNLLLTRP